MNAFILAAGRGHRLKPLTDHTPKPLIPVKGLPLIQYHLEAFSRVGITDIVVNVAWHSTQIIEYLNNHAPPNLNIRISDESDQALETGGGILKALPLMDNKPFIVVNADVYTNFNFRTLKNKQNDNDWVHLIMVDNPAHNVKGDFNIKNGRLILDESRPYTYSGIGLYHPDLFSSVKHKQNSAFSVVPLIKYAIAQEHASAELFKGQWSDVGTVERLEEISQ